ncbi:hypothetical protein SASPL_120291 [Salvia splendens]|uniref:Uncharacterized protein n=1 Tax=Salvia splendens TaxID=180675 RepID=A0A8X8ZV36_SALSN|nr:hypothetical protein SASPL_120291 [Salvia splendens]
MDCVPGSWLENEDVPFLDGLGDEDVGGGDEADVEFAFEHQHDLGGAWVLVGRVEAARGVVDAGQGDAECVDG